MSYQNQQAEQIKSKIRQKYSWLSAEDIETCYNLAFKDVVFALYPSANNRPPIDKINLDFYYMQTVYDRMEEIFDIVGGKNLTMYKENGITWQYGVQGYSSALIRIMPRASVPK